MHINRLKGMDTMQQFKITYDITNMCRSMVKDLDKIMLMLELLSEKEQI